MSMWEYIRRKKRKTIMQVANDTNISRTTIYLFEKGKCQNIKLMSYYLRLNGRDIDNKIANILDENYEMFYKELRGE